MTTRTWSVTRALAVLLPAVLLSVSWMAGGLGRVAPVEAQAASIQVVMSPTLNQQIFTDGNGMTLYVFARDAAGVSNCNGGCATTWPPVQAASAPALPSGIGGTLSVISRSDGGSQVAYNGMPLYTYSGDKQAGDTNGQGIGGVWSAATPQM